MTGALQQAGARQTYLALSVVRLFKAGFTPGVNTTLAELVANECDFDDYAPIPITTWNDPVLASVPGYTIDGGEVTFRCAADQATPNIVGGWWVNNAGGTVLVDIGVFDPTRPMQLALQSIKIVPTELFPALQV
jgi:hypothetical protein